MHHVWHRWGGRTIHTLLREAGVSAVFHGHDHYYMREELDGVIYQARPVSARPPALLPACLRHVARAPLSSAPRPSY